MAFLRVCCLVPAPTLPSSPTAPITNPPSLLLGGSPPVKALLSVRLKAKLPLILASPAVRSDPTQVKGLNPGGLPALDF